MIHTQTGDLFENPQDFFTTPKPDGHHGSGAQLVTAGSDSHYMRGNPVELHH